MTRTTLIAIAAVALLAVLGGLAGGDLIRALTGPTAPDRTAFEADLRSSAQGGIFEVWRRYRPQEYGETVDALYALVEAGEPDATVRAEAEARTAAVRRGLADGAIAAPDAMLVAYFRSTAAVMRHYQGSAPQTCARFAAYGAANIAGPDASTLPAVVIENARIGLEALFEAEAAGVERAPADDAVYDAFAGFARSQGMSEASLALVTQVLIDDPGYCAASIALVDALAAMPAPEGPRLRATLLRDAAQR
ncbi:MAG: hypothetical protein AAF677_08630 [Pseudomonadota bacterium]